MGSDHWNMKHVTTRYFCFCNEERNLDITVEADSDEKAAAVADRLVPLYGPYATGSF